MGLDGMHALVTGGGTGIGLAIARALAEEGAAVTITGRRLDTLRDAEAETDRVFGIAMDVRDEADVRDKVAKAAAARGPIRICVANAGIAEGRALHKTEMAFWRDMMATNLDGAFVTIRECLSSMREAGWGRVIAVASIAGLRGLKGAPCYTASKHGLVGLTRSLAADYAGSPITFNAICPGYVATPIVDRNADSIAARAGISRESALDMMVQTNPGKRLVTPEEVASCALWLVGPGSDSVNGQAIEIAGGSP